MAKVHIQVWLKIVPVKWYAVLPRHLLHFSKSIGHLPNAEECLQMFREPPGQTQPLHNAFQDSTEVLQRAGSEEKYCIQLKLNQWNRIYLFELKFFSFRCYQLSMRAHYTLRGLVPLQIQREKSRLLICQCCFLLYAWYSFEIYDPIPNQTQSCWIYEVWQKHSLSGISASY